MKVYVVLRQSYGRFSYPEFFDVFSDGKAARDFCKKKNDHPNTPYEYTVKGVFVKECVK